MANNVPAKIAVLISGQIRSDDNDIRDIAKSCEAINADVFICVWEKRGAKGFGGGQGLLQLARVFGNKMALVLPRNWIGANMRKVFPEADHILPDLGEVTPESLREIFPKAVIDVVPDRADMTLPYMDSNSLRMLYMMDRCNKMKLKAEADSGYIYDVVARHRPDIKINYRAAMQKTLDTGRIVFPKSDDAKPHQLHDIYWVGSSKDNDKLTELYQRMEETKTEGWGGIHKELKDWTDKKNVNIIKFPCGISGINDASFGASDAQQITARNFAKAVAERKLDVEAAGDEIMCDLFEPVLTSVTDGRFSAASAKEKAFQRVLAFRGRPRFALYMLQAIGWQFALDPSAPLGERARYFALNLAIDRLSRNDDAAKWAAGQVEPALADAGPVSDIVRFFLSSAVSASDGSSLYQRICAQVCVLAKISATELEAEIRSKHSDTLAAQSNWRWMAAGLERENNPKIIIALTTYLLENECYARVLVNHAATASEKIGEAAQVLPLLLRAAQIAPSAMTYGDLGSYYLKSGEAGQAKAAFAKAVTYQHCPSWVKHSHHKLDKE